MTRSNALFARVVYGSAYSFLRLLIAVLLLVSAGDIINQSRLRGNLYPILIVSICYVSAVIIVGFVYLGRLYINRTVLNAIPKAWVPIEPGDSVPKAVRQLIAAGLSRSAAVALVAQPRGILCRGAADEPDGGPERDEQRAEAVKKEMGIDLPPCRPVWGPTEQPGWAPPDAADLGSLQYSAVVAELPNLIEAKALTLAPLEAAASSLRLLSPGAEPMLDPDAVALLQRPAYMGLRAYLAHLGALGAINGAREVEEKGGEGAGGESGEGEGEGKERRTLAAVVATFITTYEHARFSTQMLSHAQFRGLMHDLATILRNMTPLDPARLQEYANRNGDDDGDDDGDNDDNDDNDDHSTYSYRPSVNDTASAVSDSEGGIDSNAAPSTPTSAASSVRRGGGVLQAGENASLRSSRSGVSSSGGSSMSAHSGTTTRRRYMTSPLPPSFASSTSRKQQQQQQQQRLLPHHIKRVRPGLSQASSEDSFAQSRRPYPVSQPSSASIRSASSAASLASGVSGASSGSVIRLADRADPSQLPYVLQPRV